MFYIPVRVFEWTRRNCGFDAYTPYPSGSDYAMRGLFGIERFAAPRRRTFSLRAKNKHDSHFPRKVQEAEALSVDIKTGNHRRTDQ